MDNHGKEAMRPGRDAFLAALDRRDAGRARPPLWELEFHGWDAAGDGHLVLGHAFEALDGTDRERALQRNADLLLAVSAEFGYAALTGPGPFWNQAPGQLAYYCLPGDARFRQLELLRRRAPADLALVGATTAILWADYDPEFCYRLVDDPESVDGQVERLLAQGLDNARRLRDCGADVIMVPCDLADNAGPFYNPEQMRRWVLPALDRFAAAVHERGMRLILHSDGDLTRSLDDLAATGLDALQAIDPVAGMDLQAAKAIVGDQLCLCGNVDVGLLLRGGPTAVAASTTALLSTWGDAGGLVLGASNAVQPDVPLASYQAMVAAWRSWNA